MCAPVCECGCGGKGVLLLENNPELFGFMFNMLMENECNHCAIFAHAFDGNMYAALKVGSFGLTRLFTSFGVIISTFYGILFLGEPTTIMTYLAFSMILVSLFLMNYQKHARLMYYMSFLIIAPEAING